MDDLISRKAALDALGECPDNWEDSPEEVEAVNSWLYAMNAIGSVPSIPAVPLDRLCEWLANSFSDPPCCTLENVRCKMECRGFTQMDYSECWRHVVTKWMEEQDAVDRR